MWRALSWMLTYLGKPCNILLLIFDQFWCDFSLQSFVKPVFFERQFTISRPQRLTHTEFLQIWLQSFWKHVMCLDQLGDVMASGEFNPIDTAWMQMNEFIQIVQGVMDSPETIFNVVVYAFRFEPTENWNWFVCTRIRFCACHWTHAQQSLKILCGNVGGTFAIFDFLSIAAIFPTFFTRWIKIKYWMSRTVWQSHL